MQGLVTPLKEMEELRFLIGVVAEEVLKELILSLRPWLQPYARYREPQLMLIGPKVQVMWL